MCIRDSGYVAKVDAAGRVLIPRELREQLGVKPGATVTITPVHGRIVLEPRLSILSEAQAYFRALAPETDVWSNELLAERRRGARRGRGENGLSGRWVWGK